jgi:site-specific recombinase XerD
MSDKQEANWNQCIETWLGTRGSINTKRMYSIALRDFQSITTVKIWEAGYREFVNWRDDMLKRGLKGTTINARLDSLSSLYIFASCEYLVENDDGSIEPLAKYNQLNARSLRVKVKQYANSRALSVSEVKKLLGSIDQSTLSGMRDYALLLGYLNLGRRNSEWRIARVCDFEVSNGEYFYRWSGKGQVDNLISVPRELWNVINSYVTASGGRGPFDYIFMNRWGEPISGRGVGDLIKKYVKLAGIPGRVRVHDLRHTAAMLRRENGADVEEIRSFLGHSSLLTTQIYLHRLQRVSDSRAKNVFKMIAVKA